MNETVEIEAHVLDGDTSEYTLEPGEEIEFGAGTSRFVIRALELDKRG